MTLEVLRMFVAITLVLFGVAAFVAPTALGKTVGLSTNSKGQAEIRISWGSLYLAMGAGALLLDSAAAYQLIGLMFSAMALARTVHILHNRRLVDNTYLGILAYEVVVAVLCLLA
ncbi:MAG: hypothetical protein NZ750_03930 [Anaerolineae bacterium]|nr:hypothetical protein [Anaerolineae bacterium]MDW8171471.1 hypothetical protein [Anaerolineae bacterium]